MSKRIEFKADARVIARCSHPPTSPHQPTTPRRSVISTRSVLPQNGQAMSGDKGLSKASRP